jgi:hypothetical protein
MPQLMRLVAILTIALVLASSATAQQFSGENCRLNAPPPDSGEIFFDIGKVSAAGRVYPRLSQIPSRYTGCQVTWVSINGGSPIRSLTLFAQGRVVSVDPVPDGIPLCNAGEKVVDTGCTSRKTAVPVSYPPGCAARTVESKAVPRDCTEAFQAEFKLHDQITD